MRPPTRFPGCSILRCCVRSCLLRSPMTSGSSSVPATGGTSRPRPGESAALLRTVPSATRRGRLKAQKDPGATLPGSFLPSRIAHMAARPEVGSPLLVFCRSRRVSARACRRAPPTHRPGGASRPRDPPSEADPAVSAGHSPTGCARGFVDAAGVRANSSGDVPRCGMPSHVFGFPAVAPGGGRCRCAGLSGAVTGLRGWVSGLLRFTSGHPPAPARPLPLRGGEKAGGGARGWSGAPGDHTKTGHPVTTRWGWATTTARPHPRSLNSPTGGDGPEGPVCGT